MHFFCVAALLSLLPCCAGDAPIPLAPEPSLPEWINICRALPEYADGRGRTSAFSGRTHWILNAVDEFVAFSRTSSLSDPKQWFGAPPPADFFECNKNAYYFVQKLPVAAGTILVFRGDLHGDVHTLIWELQWLYEKNYFSPNGDWKLTPNAPYLLFLGDYVDRGDYGAEIIYTLVRLKMANPDKVVLCRGNHEDIDITTRFGFMHECMRKFGEDWVDAIGRISKVYEMLPVALFLQGSGKNIQCCHGGFELSLMNIGDFLADPQGKKFCVVKADRGRRDKSENIKIQKALEDFHGKGSKAFELTEDLFGTFQNDNLGLQWSDFTLAKNDASSVERGRGLMCSQDLAQTLMKKYGIFCVIRAHQHNEKTLVMLDNQLGLILHWERESLAIPQTVLHQNDVVTCDVARENYFNKYSASVPQALYIETFYTMKVPQRGGEWILDHQRGSMHLYQDIPVPVSSKPANAESMHTELKNFQRSIQRLERSWRVRAA